MSEKSFLVDTFGPESGFGDETERLPPFAESRAGGAA